MKDIDKLKELLTSFKIGFKESHHCIDNEESLHISMKVGYDNVIGYNLFYTEWIFNPEGTFIDVGIWE